MARFTSAFVPDTPVKLCDQFSHRRHNCKLVSEFRCRLFANLHSETHDAIHTLRTLRWALRPSVAIPVPRKTLTSTSYFFTGDLVPLCARLAYNYHFTQIHLGSVIC